MAGGKLMIAIGQRVETVSGLMQGTVTATTDDDLYVIVRWDADPDERYVVNINNLIELQG